MTILGRDPGNEFRKLIPSPNGAQDNASLSVGSEFHRVPLRKTGLLRYRKGNADSQAVPPLGNPGITSHVYLL
jgi:hypothetical protein